MSRFFTEIEFEPSGNDDKPDYTKVAWCGAKLKQALEEIEAEIEKIRHGTSELVPRAIDPGRFGFPAHNAIKVFISNPSDKTFEGIHAICRQDFTGRAGDKFYELLKAARSTDEAS